MKKLSFMFILAMIMVFSSCVSSTKHYHEDEIIKSAQNMAIEEE